MLTAGARTPPGLIPKIVATFVYASSQGQRTHSARTNIAATATKEPDVVVEPVEIKETEDNLLASSSIIDEVAVAPDELPVSLSLYSFYLKCFPFQSQDNLLRVPTTTGKPGRPVPRFCKLLKI